jgi:hypothetical protein
MATVIEAPNVVNAYRAKQLFLAGGITGCPDWQAQMIQMLSDLPITILNPRRQNFPINDPTAAPEQIAWEYRALNHCSDVILFWFCKETENPIVLYELGYQMGFKQHANGPKIFVGIEPGYKRKLDVEIQTKLAGPGEVSIVHNLTRLSQIVRDHYVNYYHLHSGH